MCVYIIVLGENFDGIQSVRTKNDSPELGLISEHSISDTGNAEMDGVAPLLPISLEQQFNTVTDFGRSCLLYLKWNLMETSECRRSSSVVIFSLPPSAQKKKNWLLLLLIV
jgi:hypothetical protein